MPAYSFKLNGTTTKVDSWDPAQPLLYVLRNSLGVHGPKFGCGLGQCGACTVLLDGRATRSCVTTVAQANGKSVTTIEGLAQGGQLHKVQEAFWNEHGAQCGFCTPGMIMLSKQILDRNPNPTEAEIRHGLEGNICRCTGYQHIVNAVRAAARA